MLSSAVTTALTQNDVLRHIFALTDGTTLTRAGAVCKTWRQQACADTLWRTRVYSERMPYVADQPRRAEPPLWAIEQPQSHVGTGPSRSWRQAYRLLAMLERGRPDGDMPVPVIEIDAGASPQQTFDTPVEPQWITSEAALNLLQRTFGPAPQVAWEVRDAMSGDRRQVTVTARAAAVRDVPGNVTVAWQPQRGSVQTWRLPLRERGCPAAEVILQQGGASDQPSVGDVHVMTRSGKRWIRWQKEQQDLQTTFSGRTGRIVYLGERACWLACRLPEGTREGFALYDLHSGQVLSHEEDNHILHRSSLLTELGPMVAWVPGFWHVRICWSTRPDWAELPANDSGDYFRKHFWGNRPLRLDTRRLPGAASVLDMKLSSDVPGRVLVDVAVAASDGSESVWPAYIDGWGCDTSWPNLNRNLAFAPS